MKITLEEAIKEFESELEWAELNIYPYISKQKVEADKMAIKALEQKPCEDCISRQAVLALAKEECETAIIPYRRFVKDINALPSVAP